MTISRFYRILLALCGLVGVSIQIHDDGWGMLLYYTVLSNILVFSSLIFFIIYDFKKGNIGQLRSEIKLLCAKAFLQFLQDKLSHPFLHRFYYYIRLILSNLKILNKLPLSSYSYILLIFTISYVKNNIY